VLKRQKTHRDKTAIVQSAEDKSETLRLSSLIDYDVEMSVEIDQKDYKQSLSQNPKT